MTLDQLKTVENLNIRTYNVCRYSGFKNIEDILLFQANKKSFKHLRNCGTKCENELTRVCAKYSDYSLILQSKLNLNHKFKDSFDTLRSNQLNFEIFNKEVLLTFESLTFKSRNTLIKLFENEIFNVVDFVNKTILVGFEFYNIWSCGAKTVKELNWFREYVKWLIEDRKDKSITPGEFILDELRRIIGFTKENDDNLLRLIDKKELNILYLIDRFVLTSLKFKTIDRAIFNLS